MKILICDSIDKDAIQELKNIGYDVFEKTGLKEDELKHVVTDADVIVVRSATKLTRPVITATKNLKLIIRGGVGMDNIDKSAADEKSVKVMNTPAATAISVAELTICLMLSAYRKITDANNSVKQGKWEKKLFEGKELYGKTLGLVGLGRIGSEVAKRAIAFGMNVLFTEIPEYILPSTLKDIPLKRVDRDELFKNADIITIHVPYDKTTENSISRNEFEKMKNGVVLINCARGGIVDEHALAEALKSGRIACACVDVFSKEPIEKENPLLNAPNVILTPHLGASTYEGQQRVGKEVVSIIKQFFK